MSQYSRRDALRILHVRAAQLNGWERSGLIPPKDLYTFQDLVQLRKLRDLRAMRLSAANIRASVRAMRSVSGMANPLLEAGAVRRGSRLVFRHSGAIVEPIARQFVFDFDAGNQTSLPEVGGATGAADEARVAGLFFEAVQLEEASRMDEAAHLYARILELNPVHAPACINLGTIHYNQKRFALAESLYHRATAADPGYALAFFDLGNALDELQRLTEAIEAYSRAILLVPHYADAHYNLALAYERTGERRRALRHWMAYLKLDPIGPWASHARGQARKILEREKLTIVSRSGVRRGMLPRQAALVPVPALLQPKLTS